MAEPTPDPTTILAAVASLHQPVDPAQIGNTMFSTNTVCCTDNEPWPCQTTAALGPGYASSLLKIVRAQERDRTLEIIENRLTAKPVPEGLYALGLIDAAGLILVAAYNAGEFVSDEPSRQRHGNQISREQFIFQMTEFLTGRDEVRFENVNNDAVESRAEAELAHIALTTIRALHACVTVRPSAFAKVPGPAQGSCAARHVPWPCATFALTVDLAAAVPL